MSNQAQKDREWEEVNRIAASLPDVVRRGEMVGSGSRLSPGQASSAFAHNLHRLQCEAAVELTGHRVF